MDFFGLELFRFEFESGGTPHTHPHTRPHFQIQIEKAQVQKNPQGSLILVFSQELVRHESILIQFPGKARADDSSNNTVRTLYDASSFQLFGSVGCAISQTFLEIQCWASVPDRCWCFLLDGDRGTPPIFGWDTNQL